MERLAYKDELPGSRRAPCLGCSGLVVAARDPHCLIGGKRDGSLLVVMDVDPQRSWATDIDRLYTDRDLYLLGIAHRDCVGTARQRLEAQEVELPAELPQLLVDEEIGDLPQLHLPPPSAVCAFCGAAGATDEHVFPKWVSRTLTALAPLHMHTDYGPRRLRTIDITAPVCAKCNTRSAGSQFPSAAGSASRRRRSSSQAAIDARTTKPAIGPTISPVENETSAAS